MPPSVLRFGPFVLDLDRLCLRGPTGEMELRPKSFEVLRYLVERSGRVRIRYRLAAGDREKLLRGMDAAARILFASGASEVSTLHAHAVRMRSPAELSAMARRPSGPNQLGVLSAHVNGTCRIGTDPATSGCTPDGERHGVPGLYVADGSLVPTAPGVNPQETIMALATLVSERIAARHPAGRAGSAGTMVGAAANS